MHNIIGKYALKCTKKDRLNGKQGKNDYCIICKEDV